MFTYKDTQQESESTIIGIINMIKIAKRMHKITETHVTEDPLTEDLRYRSVFQTLLLPAHCLVYHSFVVPWISRQNGRFCLSFMCLYL